MELTQIQKDWLKALRSGEYNQGRNRLKTAYDDPLKPTCYCCLGVANELLTNKSTSDTRLSQPSFEELGLSSSTGDFSTKNLHFRKDQHEIDIEDILSYHHYTLASLNDELKWTFPQIADFIEDNVEHIFTNEQASK